MESESIASTASSGAFHAGDTIADTYKSIGGFTSGFDYMRIGLAVAVVFQHSVITTDRALASSIFGGWTRPLLAFILPMFFALSGFLVAASLIKKPSIPSFMALRFVRLVPALAVEILLSALILGPLVTTDSLTEYFSSREFFAYFLNIVGDIHFTLPGVFKHNHLPNMVNGSLWTVPFELDCYVALMAIYMAGFISKPKLLIGTIGFLAIGGTFYTFARHNPVYQNGPVGGYALVVAFLSGVAMQVFATRIRLNRAMFLMCAVCSALLLLRFETSFLACVPMAYVTVYLGMLNPKKVPMLFSGDYSYGLYLFAFPLQQLEVMVFPHYRWWLYNAAFTLVAGFAYAAFSWWCIEKPILSRKKDVTQAADRLFSFIPAIPLIMRLRRV
jgi:peptidoglycan/LPS O-acetylase OafA/YrhL